MRRLLLALVLSLTAGGAQAQISLLGLQNSLIQFALRQISSPGELEITAEGVQEAEDGRTELAGVRVADGEGVWLEIDAVGLRWSPTRILRGELEINRLFARGVRVLRRPVPAGVELAEDAEATDDAPFDWPRAPIATRIDEMTLEDVAVAEGVIADQSIRFDATGAARDEGDEQAVSLNVTRTDAVEGVIALDYLRDFADGTLRLDLDAQEAAGGLVAELAGLPDDSASRLTVAADGPLTDWSVRLAAEAEQVLTAEGGGTIVLGPPLAVDVALTVVPGPEIEPQLAAVLGERAELVARAAEDANGVIRIEEGAIRSPALTLDAAGTFERPTGALDLEVALEARAALSALTEGVAFESIGFEGDVDGTLDALRAEGALRLAGLRTAPADVGAATLDAVVTREGPVIGFRVEGDAEGLRLDRLSPETVGAAALRAEGRWDGEAAELAVFSFESPLLAAEASGRVDVAGDAAGLDYAVSAPALAPIASAYGVDAGGAFRASGRLEGTLAAPRLAGEAALTELRYAQEALGRVTLTHDATFGATPEGTALLTAEGSRFGPARIAGGFRLDQPTLALRDVEADVLGVVASGGATVNLETLLADGSLEARIADLGPLSELAGAPVRGSANLALTLDAEGGRQDATLTGDVADFAGFDARVAAADLDVAVTDALGPDARAEGTLDLRGLAAAGAEIASLRFEGSGSDFTGAPSAQGVLTAEGLAYAPAEARVASLRFEGSLSELSVAEGVLTAEGLAAAGAEAASLRLEATGENLAAAPAVEGVLTAEGIAYPGAEATVASLRFEGSGRDLLAAPAATGVLTVEGIAAAGAEVASLRLEAAGEDLLAAPAVEGVLTAQDLAYPAADASAASLRLEADARDLLAAPAGTAALRVERLAAAGYATPALTLDAGLTRDGVPRATADLRAEPGRFGELRLGALTVDAAVDDPEAAGRRFDVDARLGASDLGAARLSSARLTAQGPAEAVDATLAVDGTAGDEPLSARARARLDLAAPEPMAEVAALRASLGDAEVALRRPLRVTAGEATAAQGLDLSLPGGSLRGDATLHPDGLSGELALDLDDVVPLATLADAPVAAGSVEARARFDTRPGSAGATATVRGAGLKPDGVAIDLGGFDLDADARWNGRRATVEATVTGPYDQPLALTAATALVPTEGLLPAVPAGAGVDGRLRWAGRIGDLWALVPAADHVVDGDVRIDLGFSGPLTGPRLSGDVSLTDGTYQNLEFGTILTDLTLTSEVQPDGGFALRARATDGAEGVVTADARYAGGALTAQAGTTGAVLVRRDDVTAQVSADLALGGPLEALALTGRVTVDRAEVRLVNSTPPSVVTLGDVRIKGDPPPPPEEEGAAAVTLDLSVTSPDGIYVRGRGLDSQWGMDLSVTGDAAQPVVVGAIEKVRGQLALVGAVFDLERGAIRFSGGQPIDPTLDVALIRDAGDVRGGIVVRGTASDPIIAFESQPQLPEGEVLPRVLFGKSQQSLTASEALQLAAGLATLLDGSGGVLDSVRATTGLDVLRVEGQGDDAEVTVGRNVADGVFVGAKQPLDGGPARVRVEVEVFPNVIVDSEISQGGGESTLGLGWRRDF